MDSSSVPEPNQIPTDPQIIIVSSNMDLAIVCSGCVRHLARVRKRFGEDLGRIWQCFGKDLARLGKEFVKDVAEITGSS